MSNHKSSTILDLMANAIDTWIYLLSKGDYEELAKRLRTARKDLKTLIEKEDGELENNHKSSDPYP